MSTFSYRIKDKSGRTIEGSMVGEDRRVVVARLQEMGHYVLDVREFRPLSQSVNPFLLFMRWIINPLFGGATVSQLMVFFTQFSVMMKAGMSLSQAMNGLCTRGGSLALRKAVGDMLGVINQGGPLSEAMTRHPALFPDLHVALIRAAEAGGKLEDMITRIAEYLEQENNVRNRLRLATLYPKILVVLVILLPNIRTLLMDGFRSYFHQTMIIVGPILVCIAVIWIVWRLLNQIRPFRAVVDAVKVMIPKLGTMVRMLALAKFYRVMAAMVSAGAPLSSSVLYAADSTGNQYLTQKLRPVAPWVEHGQKLSEGLRNQRVLPDMALDMITTGEQTGRLDEMLNKAAEYTEQDAEVLIFRYNMLLGILLIVAVGAYIGNYVVRFYMDQYRNVLY